MDSSKVVVLDIRSDTCITEASEHLHSGIYNIFNELLSGVSLVRHNTTALSFLTLRSVSLVSQHIIQPLHAFNISSLLVILQMETDCWSV